MTGTSEIVAKHLSLYALSITKCNARHTICWKTIEAPHDRKSQESKQWNGGPLKWIEKLNKNYRATDGLNKTDATLLKLRLRPQMTNIQMEPEMQTLKSWSTEVDQRSDWQHMRLVVSGVCIINSEKQEMYKWGKHGMNDTQTDCHRSEHGNDCWPTVA